MNLRVSCLSQGLMDTIQFGAKMINIFLTVCIAIITWLRVCRGLNVNIGRYGYKLFAPAIITPAIYTIFRLEFYPLSFEVTFNFSVFNVNGDITHYRLMLRVPRLSVDNNNVNNNLIHRVVRFSSS